MSPQSHVLNTAICCFIPSYYFFHTRVQVLLSNIFLDINAYQIQQTIFEQRIIKSRITDLQPYKWSQRKQIPNYCILNPCPLSICTWFLTFYSLKFRVWWTGFFYKFELHFYCCKIQFKQGENQIHQTWYFKLEKKIKCR